MNRNFHISKFVIEQIQKGKYIIEVKKKKKADEDLGRPIGGATL